MDQDALTSRLEKHALAILEQNNLLNLPNTRWIDSGEQVGKLKAVIPKLLYYLIVESQKFGGTVLNHFWEQIGTCDEKLKNNIESLKKTDFVSAQESFDALFQGLDPQNADFHPVLEMAAEFFTHLGIALMNSGGKKSGTSTAHSVGDAVSVETVELVRKMHVEGYIGKRRQGALKDLSFKRDGDFCLLTRRQFRPSKPRGSFPIIAHIIPNTVDGKPETLKCIAIFAGADAAIKVIRHLNEIGNVMNMHQEAHTSYDNLEWGIEAIEKGGEVRYFFRMVPTDPTIPSPDLIVLEEGDEIQFGQGPDGELLDKGPITSLCNLQLAVARVLKMSGAADIILKWKDEADDEGCHPFFVASEEFCEVLDAKLFLSGRAALASASE